MAVLVLSEALAVGIASLAGDLPGSRRGTQRAAQAPETMVAMGDQPDLDTVRESLRRLLELIDAGSIESTTAERAYLAGLLAGLEISERTPLR